MSTAKKSTRELGSALREFGLDVEASANGCTVYRGQKKVGGYTMSNGTHSISGAIRDLRKRGVLPLDEVVGAERTARVQPAETRKARARRQPPVRKVSVPEFVEPVRQLYRPGTAAGTALVAAAAQVPTPVVEPEVTPTITEVVLPEETPLMVKGIRVKRRLRGPSDLPRRTPLALRQHVREALSQGRSIWLAQDPSEALLVVA